MDGNCSFPGDNLVKLLFGKYFFKRTANGHAALIKDMSVNHGGTDIFMTQ